MADAVCIVVRADASPSIGLGHVARSMTLSRACARAGAHVTFLGDGIPDQFQVLEHDCLVIAPAGSETAEDIVARSPDLVVVDGYRFTRDFFDALVRANVRHAVIDDNAETAATEPAAVLNPNLHATPELYGHLRSQPVLLLGQSYALIRPEIERLAHDRAHRSGRGIFVAMGGTDPAGLTVPITTALAGAGQQIQVAVGPAVAQRAAVVERVEQISGASIVDDYEVALAACKVAVLAAGSSLWEAACLGRPTIGVIVADNQSAAASAALEHGILVACCDARGNQAAAAAEVAQIVAHLDPAAPTAGRPDLTGGADRAALQLMELARPTRSAAGLDEPRGAEGGGVSVTLRAATLQDSAWLLELRNDPAVVEASRVAAKVAPDEHTAWLADTLGRDDRHLYVACIDGHPVAQVRLDVTEDGATVSIAVHSEHRGQGNARRILAAVQRRWQGTLLAEVRSSNAPSLALFRGLDFVPVATIEGFVHLRWAPSTCTQEITSCWS